MKESTYFVGEQLSDGIVMPRKVNVLSCPPLSSKLFLNAKGPRADVPAWSVRGEGFSLKTLGAPADVTKVQV